MAELQQQDNRKQHGVRKSKKLSTRIDLTPMVDLGFLLITFFIFTTTLTESRAMVLNLPTDKPVKEPMEVGAEKTISLILSSDNKIFYYNGNAQDAMNVTGYNAAGLRNILQQKKKVIAAKFGTDTGMVVLIKPTDKSSYNNVVNVLDEMLINDVRSYVMMDVDAKELALAEKIKQ